jgi:hypothetical protein
VAQPFPGVAPCVTPFLRARDCLQSGQDPDHVSWGHTDLNPNECLQPYSYQGGNIGIAHSRTFRPIVDGSVIITAQDESAIPSWDLFSLQWDLIRMASLCGAAEASDDDDWESEDGDEDYTNP